MTRTFVLALVLSAVSVAPSSATTRYVAPDGTGSACTQAQPCAVATATGPVDCSGLQAGDEIVFGAGTYGSPQASLPELPQCGVPIVLRGATQGRFRPVVHVVRGPILREGGAIRDLTIIATNGLGVGVADGAVAERVLAATLTVEDTCMPFPGSTLRTTVCDNRSTPLSAVATGAAAQATSTVGAHLEGVSAIGNPDPLYGAAMYFRDGPVTTVVDSIADCMCGRDDLQRGSASGALTTTLYETAAAEAVASETGSIRQLPVYRDAAGRDLRLAAGSPGIDAGSGAGQGPYDLDGNVRVLGSAIDVGAYEFVAEAPVIGDVRLTTEGDAVTVTFPVDTRGGATRVRAVVDGAERIVAERLGSLAGAQDTFFTIHGKWKTATITADSAGGVVTHDMAAPVPAPTASLEPEIDVTSTTATLRGTALTGGAEGTARFVLATGQVVEQKLTATEASQPVTAVLTGLTPGTTYTYFLRVETPGGSAETAARTFTTAAAPVPVTPVTPVVPRPPLTPSLSLSVGGGRAGGQLLLSRRSVSLYVRCGGVACSVKGTGVVRTGRRTLGRLTFPSRGLQVAADTRGTIRIRSSAALRRKVRALLDRKPKAKVRILLEVTFTGADGSAITKVLTVQVRRLRRER